MSLAQIISAAGSTLSSVGAASALVTPYARNNAYTFNRLWPNNILSIADYTMLYYKKLITNKQFLTYALNLGYAKDEAENYIFSNQYRLSIIDAVQLYRRKKISIEEFKDIMFANGVFDDNIQNIMNATEYFPSPDDVIRFAIRDVYSPDTVVKYQLLGDLPPKYLEEADKAGLPIEQAKNYWAAHWSLPSPNMGFEMMQRNIISENDLKELLKILDIAPAWRDRMIKLNYKVLTRVDVRRMWQVGTITNFPDLVTAYRNWGASPGDAEKLADFTVKTTTDKLSGLTRANVGTAYLERVIGDDTLTDLIKQLFSDEYVAQFWIDYYQHKLSLQLAKERKTQIIADYQTGGLTIDEIRSQLIREGASTTWINSILNDLQNLSKTMRKLPSKEDVLRWYTLGVITDKQVFEYMRSMNYTDDDIINYILELTDMKAPPKRKYLSIKQYGDLLLGEYITFDYFIATLVEQNYSADDIIALLKSLTGVSNEPSNIVS